MACHVEEKGGKVLVLGVVWFCKSLLVSGSGVDK